MIGGGYNVDVQTTPGKVMASFVPFFGVFIFAMPTSVLGAGFIETLERPTSTFYRKRVSRLSASTSLRGLTGPEVVAQAQAQAQHAQHAQQHQQQARQALQAHPSSFVDSDASSTDTVGATMLLPALRRVSQGTSIAYLAFPSRNHRMPTP
jgi:hypothetical protein